MKDLPKLVVSASLAMALAMGAAGCKSNSNQNAAQQDNPSQDPANANVAPVSNASDNTAAPSGAYTDPNSQYGQSPAKSDQQQAYSSPTEPGSASQPSKLRSNQPSRYDEYSTQPDQYAEDYSPGDNYDNYNDYTVPVDYAPQPPPALPTYDQPPCPGQGHIWTPGYWNYDSGQGYYWVPGAWVLAPFTGALWTPGWWGYNSGRYGWHRGYWGRHVGYYGGIDYGHGYVGHGYEG